MEKISHPFYVSLLLKIGRNLLHLRKKDLLEKAFYFEMRRK